MLDEMDAGQIAEWMAFHQLQDEAQKKAELAAKAERGVRSHKRRGK